MIVKTTFFAGLDQIELPVTPRRGERFADVYNLTTDRSRIAEVVSPFAHGLGSVEASYLLGGSVRGLVYRISEQEVDETDSSSSLGRLLIADMLALNTLQFWLWVLKDNAARYDRAWIVAPLPGGRVMNSNIWESRHSRADGTSSGVGFSSEELRLARSPRHAAALHIHSSNVPTMLTAGSLRFQRFQYFVGIGRSSHDVAMKIAQYCSGLEALVSTAQTELSHQVSERVAALLAPAGEMRIAIFKQVKEAYGYRSKAVHGAPFKPRDADRLRECAIAVDGFCRALVLIYFDAESGFRAAIEGSDQTATEFFVELTLGLSMSANGGVPSMTKEKAL